MAVPNTVSTDIDPDMLHLVSLEGCAFAQAVHIALVHKNTPFRHTQAPSLAPDATALSPRPDWYRTLSPEGRSPVLHHRGRVLHDSALIDQYLDEVVPERPLMPSDPADRLVARTWLHRISTTLPELWFRTLMAPAAGLAESADRLCGFLAEWEAALGDHGDEGPWLFGARWTLPDLFMTPFYERFGLGLGGFRMPDEERLPRVHRHRRASLEHPDYVQTRHDPDMLTTVYRLLARA